MDEQILEALLTNGVIDKGILVYLIIQNIDQKRQIRSLEHKTKELVEEFKYKLPEGCNLRKKLSLDSQESELE
jgi:hypothetical protein